MSKRLEDENQGWEEDPEVFSLRDTVEVPSCIKKNPDAGGEEGICGGTKGLVVIRFITDNPGAWLLHCVCYFFYISNELAYGMAHDARFSCDIG